MENILIAVHAIVQINFLFFFKRRRTKAVSCLVLAGVFGVVDSVWSENFYLIPIYFFMALAFYAIAAFFQKTSPDT